MRRQRGACPGWLGLSTRFYCKGGDDSPLTPSSGLSLCGGGLPLGPLERVESLWGVRGLRVVPDPPDLVGPSVNAG